MVREKSVDQDTGYRVLRVEADAVMRDLLGAVGRTRAEIGCALAGHKYPKQEKSQPNYDVG
jgi:hypothetical protein